MSALDPQFGIKMMEIKVTEIMLHLINNAEINAQSRNANWGEVMRDKPCNAC